MKKQKRVFSFSKKRTPLFFNKYSCKTAMKGPEKFYLECLTVKSKSTACDELEKQRDLTERLELFFCRD